MITKTVPITNKLGLHARPAALLTKTANLFDCKITLSKGSRCVDAKSILNVMTLSAKCGEELTFTADGYNEKAAIESLVALVQSRFGEDE